MSNETYSKSPWSPLNPPGTLDISDLTKPSLEEMTSDIEAMSSLDADDPKLEVLLKKYEYLKLEQYQKPKPKEKPSLWEVISCILLTALLGFIGVYIAKQIFRSKN